MQDPFALPELAPRTHALSEEELHASADSTIETAPLAADGEATFGEFALGAAVGVGGMAEVRLAFRRTPRGDLERCVVKRIIPSMLGDPGYRAMFREEARLVRMLDHPNIVRALDAGEIEGVPYIAFELLEAATLHEIHAAIGELPVSAVIEVAVSVLDALAYAHALAGPDGRPLDIVHRDVSPENILVMREGRVKLADFGIARFSGRDHQTMHGSIKGKLRYMAPEQLAQADVDGRTDLFSLGIVIAELLDALDPRGRGRMVSTVRPDAPLPPALLRVLETMTAPKPALRYGSAAEVSTALAHIWGTLKVHTSIAALARELIGASSRGA
jgi:serine/threonine protein kinase